MEYRQAKKITPLAPKLSAPTIPQVAPYDEDLERRILSNSLTQSAYAHKVIATIGEKNMFFFRKHQLIYDGIRQLLAEDKAMDNIRLFEVLKKQGTLEKIGGAGSINLMLIDAIRNQVGIPDYNGDLEALKGYYARYQILIVSDKLNKGAYDLTINPTEVLQSAQHELSEVGEYVYSDLFMPVAEQAQQHADRTEANEHLEVVTIPTGIMTLDTHITGLQRKKVYVIGGYTNHGKTALSSSIALNLLREKRKVVFFNVADGTREDVLSRFVAMEGGVSYANVSSNLVPAGQYGKYIDGLSKVSTYDLHTQSEKGMQIETLEAEAKTIEAKGQVDLIVIDYIQRITVAPDSKYNHNTYTRMAHISQRLTKLAEVMDCPMIVNAQINRAGAGKMPDTTHIKDAGNIGEDADMVLLVYKEGLDNYAYNYPNQIQVKIGKNKVNGVFATAMTMVDPMSTYVTAQIIGR